MYDRGATDSRKRLPCISLGAVFDSETSQSLHPQHTLLQHEDSGPGVDGNYQMSTDRYGRIRRLTHIFPFTCRLAHEKSIQSGLEGGTTPAPEPIPQPGRSRLVPVFLPEIAGPTIRNRRRLGCPWITETGVTFAPLLTKSLLSRLK